MFKEIRKAKDQVGSVVTFVEDAKTHIEENKDVYRAAAIGVGCGLALGLAFKSRPVTVNNVINVCSHAS